jgi:hypothetical protein
MAIMHFTFDQTLTDSFIGFEYDLYRGHAQWIPPIIVNVLNKVT